MSGETMAEPASSAIGALLIKFGGVKVLGFGASLLGAGIMAIFRPPRSRKELFQHAAVALGGSLLFGGTLVQAFAGWTGWINLKTAPIDELIQFTAMVYGMVGALSWGIFGGLAVLRDKFGTDPIQTITDIKNL